MNAAGPLAPITAGFDAGGDWHDGGNGRYAKPGWSSAKALALRALRGAFAHDLSKANPDGVWLEAADDYLSRLGIAKGHAVKVRYGDAAHGLIDAVHPDGGTRPVKVKWERFADHAPSTGGITRDAIAKLDGKVPWAERSEVQAMVRASFEHDLGGGVHSEVTRIIPGGDGTSAAVHLAVYRDGNTEPIGSLAYDLMMTGDKVVANFDSATIARNAERIGTRLTAAIESGLAAQGVDRITVQAVSVPDTNHNGAYTWARTGFRWTPRSAALDGWKIGRRILADDPDNPIGRRLVVPAEEALGDRPRTTDSALSVALGLDVPDDYPTPNDVALDPTGRKVLLGLDSEGTTSWSGVKHLDTAYPKATPRVETPTVTRNTTKGDLGRGQATAARVRDAGGTGQAVVADGYLARHGHPKGSTVTVDYVDDVYADVHPADEGGRTIRTKWSRFTDDAPGPAPAPESPDPLRAPAGWVPIHERGPEAYDPEARRYLPQPGIDTTVTPDMETAIRQATWSHASTNPAWMDRDGVAHVGTAAAAAARAAAVGDAHDGAWATYQARLKPGARIAPFIGMDDALDGVWGPDGKVTLDDYDVVPYWNAGEDRGSMSLLVDTDALEPVNPDRAPLGSTPAQLQDALGTPTEQEAVEQTRDIFRGLADEARHGRLIHRTSVSSARKIVRSGRFKTQHETGTGTGDSWPGDGFEPGERRKAFEADVFGGDANPIYGLIATDSTDRSNVYGPVGFVLKPEVADRTSVTFGDSFMKARPLALDAIDTATPEQLAAAVEKGGLSGHFGLSSLATFRDGPTRGLNGYVEAQIHGGLSTSEVDSIIVFPYDSSGKPLKDRDIEAVRALGEKLGVPVHVSDEYTGNDTYGDVFTNLGRKRVPKLSEAAAIRSAGPITDERRALATRETMEQIAADAENHLAIRMYPDDLTAVIESGSVKTMHETGTSNADLGDPEERRNIEMMRLGVPWDAAPEQRPIHGTIATQQALEDASDYGPIIVLPKPDAVKGRVSFSIGDTLMSEVAPIFPADVPTASEDRLAAAVDDFDRPTNIETQLYGGLTLDQIGAIGVPDRPDPRDFDNPDPIPLPDFRKMLDDAGHPDIAIIEYKTDWGPGIGDYNNSGGDYSVLTTPPPPAPDAPAVPPAVELRDSPFDASRYPDSEILDWLAKPDLSFPEREAMDLHSAKLAWLDAEGRRRGWTDDEARAATFAIDGALDRSSDTLGWSRGPLIEAVANVDAGRVNTDLERGVVLQRAFTDAVWQARYGDATTVAVSRIVSHDDPDRSMPGVPTDGVSSWVLRENEQQVIDWFNYRDLTPEVIHADLERGRVLMLPWGEGRYRSDYVRIKGEVLAGPAPKPGRPPRDLILDPTSTADDIADALYNGTTPGGHKVTRRSVTERIVTGGPEHAPVTHRILRFNADVHDADGQPHRFGHQVTIAPGVDGEPHISVFIEGGGDDLWRDTDRYAEQVAERIGADEIAAFSPSPSTITANSDLRDFIADGWQFHPSLDASSLRNVGVDLAFDHSDIGYVTAWRDWNGRDVADIPPPQAVLDPENIAARSDALARFTYLGRKALTDRRPVPELPRQGGWVDWALARDLPDGTLIEADVDDTPRQYKVFSGRLLPFPAADAKAAAELIDEMNLAPGEGLTAKGRYPTQVKVVRYQAAPLPAPPLPPPAVPGVKTPASTVPALPLFAPGQIITGGYGGSMSVIPRGTRLRLVNDAGTPFDLDGGGDYIVLSPKQIRPSWDDRPSAVTYMDTGRKYMVTAVPDPTGPTTPDDLNVRVRNALVAEARAFKVDGAGVRAVEPFAVGAIHPSDWVTGATQDPIRDTRVPGSVLRAGAARWQAQRFPASTGNDPYGPVWRIPGTGLTGNAMWTDTPIEGVEPEVIASGRVKGALTDDKGTILFGRDYTPVPWRDAAPHPLPPEELDRRVAALRSPTQPPEPIKATDRYFVLDNHPVSAVADWLESPAGLLSREHRTISVNGRTASGPTRAVRIYRTDDGGLAFERSPFPIGAPENDLAGWDPTGDDLVLALEDPRLPAALDSVWWSSQERDGTVARVEGAMIATGFASYQPGETEPKVARALRTASERLRSDAKLPDGTIPLSYTNGRFVVDPAGTPVPSESIPYLRSEDGTAVASVTRDAAAAVLGDEAVTPDYRPVYEDAEMSWDDKVRWLGEQRQKLLLGMPGERLDHLFGPVPAELEHGTVPLGPHHVEQMNRDRALADHGRAIAHLAELRQQQIVEEPEFDSAYIGGAVREQTLTPAHAKSLTKLLTEAETLTYDPFNTTAGAIVSEAVAKRKAYVSYDEGSPVSITDPKSSLPSVTIHADGPGLIDRKRGDWIRLVFSTGGRLAFVDVHRSGSMLDEYDTYDISDSPTPAGRSPIGKRLLRLAKDMGLVSNADPRPTLAELAFLQTMEALGVEMGTDPDIEVGKPNSDKLGKIGRSTTTEAYTAQIGLGVYPRDWTSTLVGRPQRVEIATGDFYADGGGSNLSGGVRIKVADPRRYPQHRDTVIHEFGHSLERTVPGLTNAEAWHLTRRVMDSTDPEDPSRPADGGEALGRRIIRYAADFRRPYSGRVYNGETIGGNDSYEVFTTAAEDLIRPSGLVDEELRAWIMGILGLIRPEAS